MPLPLDIVEALVRTIELKDRCTASHTWRVVLYTRALAESLGADRELIKRVSRAAALHDVGKIDIPDEVLLKPARLTPDEFEVIKTHTTLGHERLVRMGEDDPLVLELVRHHHERMDGTGYPDRLTARSIPSAAKYFSVVDTFDALTSVRPYRASVGKDAAESAIDELQRGVGSRYCAESVAAFAMLFRTGNLNWILENFNDGAALPVFGGPEMAEEATGRLRRRE